MKRLTLISHYESEKQAWEEKRYRDEVMERGLDELYLAVRKDYILSELIPQEIERLQGLGTFKSNDTPIFEYLFYNDKIIKIGKDKYRVKS